MSVRRRDSVSVPRIWITFALSVLIHALVMWRLHPDMRTPSSDEKERGEARGPLSVQLVPRRSSPPSPPSPSRPRLAEPSRPRMAEAPRPKVVPREKPPPKVTPRAAPQPQERAPVIALDRPAAIPAPQAQKPAPSAPVQRAPAESDLASYIEARRRARAEPAPAAAPAAPESAASAPADEDANARANRIAAANLGLDRKPEFGAPRKGGGVFQIQRMAYDYAEFVFYGWNKDIRRNTQQLIEVRKGANSDIRIAVVRKMIAIIREHEQGDFVWESIRMGRRLTLSARQRDNAGLEDFMMREFFEDDRRP